MSGAEAVLPASPARRARGSAGGLGGSGGGSGVVTHLSHAMPRDDRVAPPNTSLAPPVAPPLSRFPISVDVVVASSSIAGEGEEAHRPSASHLGALLAHWFDRALSPTAAQVSALVSETFIISYYFPTPGWCHVLEGANPRHCHYEQLPPIADEVCSRAPKWLTCRARLLNGTFEGAGVEDSAGSGRHHHGRLLEEVAAEEGNRTVSANETHSLPPPMAPAIRPSPQQTATLVVEAQTVMGGTGGASSSSEVEAYGGNAAQLITATLLAISENMQLLSNLRGRVSASVQIELVGRVASTAAVVQALGNGSNLLGMLESELSLAPDIVDVRSPQLAIPPSPPPPPPMAWPSGAYDADSAAAAAGLSGGLVAAIALGGTCLFGAAVYLACRRRRFLCQLPTPFGLLELSFVGRHARVGFGFVNGSASARGGAPEGKAAPPTISGVPATPQPHRAALLVDGAAVPLAPAVERPTITQLEVAGMCCQSEVKLIHKKLGIMPGVSTITVNLMLRQVKVVHDHRTPPEKLVRTLNWSLLGARLLEGERTATLRRGRLDFNSLLVIACGACFLISNGTYARDECTPWYKDPFSYFSLACVAFGAPVLLARAISGLIYQRTLNMFATMFIAAAGAIALLDMWEAAAIIFFFTLSEWLQTWCETKTREHTREAAHATHRLPAHMQRMPHDIPWGIPEERDP